MEMKRIRDVSKAHPRIRNTGRTEPLVAPQVVAAALGGEPGVAGGGPKWQTVKIARATYEKAQKLVVKAARDGWRSLGVERQDPPGLGTVIDAGLAALDKRGR